MASRVTVIIGVVVLAFVAIFAFKLTGKATAEPSKYDDFAKCLASSGTKMYGAYWCPHCSNQKKLFGSSWNYVNYIECDARGQNGNPELCQREGISGYPTWIFPDGSRASGELSLRELSVRSGCALAE